MSSDEEEPDQTSREEERLSYELYFLIVRTICEKGVVKICDLRKIYLAAVADDKTVVYRPFQQVMKLVNANLKHWQGWNAVLYDDRLSYMDASTKEPVAPPAPDETERVVGLLELTLMYVFVATRPAARFPGVAHEDLMTFLEYALSTSIHKKLPSDHMEMIKKHIQPSIRADFIKKGYLNVEKTVNENDEEVFRYEWGAAARQTIDPMPLVRTFQKMTEMSSAQLKEQLGRAYELRSEQEEAVQRAGILPTRGGK